MKQRTGNLGLKAYLKLNCLLKFSGCFPFKIKKSILLKNQKTADMSTQHIKQFTSKHKMSYLP